MLTFSAKPRRRHPTSRTSAGAGLAPLSVRQTSRRQHEEPAESLPPQREEQETSAFDDESQPNRNWHDSSMELRRGLDVVEDLSLDALPEDERARLTSPQRRFR